MKWTEHQQQRWKEIGNKLQASRQEHGISIKQMADMIGCSRSKIYKFETGQPITHAEMIRRSYILAIKAKFYKKAYEEGVQETKKELEELENTINKIQGIMPTSLDGYFGLGEEYVSNDLKQ